jgi:hypothetical protein
MLRRIIEGNSDGGETDSGDTDSDASNLDFIGKLRRIVTKDGNL